MATTVPGSVYPSSPHPGVPDGYDTYHPGLHQYDPGGPFGGHATLSNDLVSYWPLDEESGTRYDLVGSNDLTDNNTVGYVSVTGPPNFPGGKAASFVAANSEKLTGTGSSAADADYTVALWTNYSIDTTYGLFDQVNGNFVLLGQATRLMKLYTRVTADTVATGSEINLSSWNFVIAWHDSTLNTINVQVNNGPVASAATGGAPGAGASTILGAWGSGPSNYLTGYLSNCGVWSRVLTAQERTDLYNSGAGLFYED